MRFWAEEGAQRHLRRVSREGATFCSNKTGVPMAELHRAVIDSLNVTFSDEKFEQYLRDQAADTEQIAARRAERENLLVQIPKLAAAEAKLAKAIAVSDDMDALTTWTPW
jgi:hypothetical protein